MKWNQFRLKTTTEAEDIVSSMLADLGIEGVQIEDKIPLTQSDKKQMFVDILPDMPEDDGCAYLTFYLDEEGQTGIRRDEKLSECGRLYDRGVPDRRCRLGK